MQGGRRPGGSLYPADPSARRVPWDGVLVRFGEIGIKSAPVRRRMLDRLRSNLEEALLRAGVEGAVERQGSRLWLAGPDAEALAGAASHVFGVVSVSPALRVPAAMEAMGDAAAGVALGRAWSSFAVRPSREGEHAFSSPEIGREVGAAVFLAAEAAGRSPRVDLGAPDLEVFVEVRGAEAYVYAEKVSGPGGLPVGTQGRVVAVVGGEDGVLAAWFMMRRGCGIVPVRPADQAAPAAYRALLAWGAPERVEALPEGPAIEAAAEVLRRRRCDAVVTGEGLGDRWPGPPAGVAVLRPLAGLDPEERERWRRWAGLGGQGAGGAD